MSRQGKSRNQIVYDLSKTEIKVSTGSISNILKEWRREQGISEPKPKNHKTESSVDGNPSINSNHGVNNIKNVVKEITPPESQERIVEHQPTLRNGQTSAEPRQQADLGINYELEEEISENLRWIKESDDKRLMLKSNNDWSPQIVFQVKHDLKQRMSNVQRRESVVGQRELAVQKIEEGLAQQRADLAYQWEELARQKKEFEYQRNCTNQIFEQVKPLVILRTYGMNQLQMSMESMGVWAGAVGEIAKRRNISIDVPQS
jgi:hypothetical protein